MCLIACNIKADKGVKTEVLLTFINHAIAIKSNDMFISRPVRAGNKF